MRTGDRCANQAGAAIPRAICYTGRMADLGKLAARLSELTWKVAFYEWAYGRLGEMDDGLGPIGEFLVGLRVGGIDGHRVEKAPVDLVGNDGTTFEIKTTGRPRGTADGHAPRHRWTIVDEADALEGRAPLADRWVFLVADFPPQAALLRPFDPFDARWWTCYVLTGEQVRDTGVRRLFTIGTLRKGNYEPVPLDSLGPEPPDDPLVRRIKFFRWAYGDLSTPFNFGRLAEFQVMRACGRITLARKSWDAVDLRARNGRSLEVKSSNSPRTTASGQTYYVFHVPIRRAGPRPGAEKRRAADFFVFVWTEPKDGTISLDLSAWRFILVPTAAIDRTSQIRSTALIKRGFPVLTAAELRARLSEGQGYRGRTGDFIAERLAHRGPARPPSAGTDPKTSDQRPETRDQKLRPCASAAPFSSSAAEGRTDAVDRLTGLQVDRFAGLQVERDL